MRRLTTAIFLFDEVEVLDFAGPFEVFSVADDKHDNNAFRVLTVAASAQAVRARNGLRVIADHTFETCPHIDLLVIPGGFGTRAVLQQPLSLEWLAKKARDAEIVFSICTGALLLGKLGLLDGKRVTTHHAALGLLGEIAPAAIVDPSQRFHDHGSLVTAAGISAGIDAALHLVGRLLGSEAAVVTANYMEYRMQ